MEVFVLKTKSGTTSTELSAIGSVTEINYFENQDDIANAVPLTHAVFDDIDIATIKTQNILAWNGIITNQIPVALVLLDTIQVQTSFVTSTKIPDGGDIGILSAPNLRQNGIHLNGTDWVLLDGDDPYANNICNAYLITLNGAKKLYARRNEMQTDKLAFAQYLSSISNYLAYDRITTYMSLHTTSSKPNQPLPSHLCR